VIPPIVRAGTTSPLEMGFFHKKLFSAPVNQHPFFFRQISSASAVDQHQQEARDFQ